MTNPLHEASAVALDIARAALTAAQLEAQGIPVGLVATAAINAGLEKVPAKDLVTALVGHLITQLSIRNPLTPDAALDELEQISTLQRLDPGQEQS